MTGTLWRISLGFAAFGLVTGAIAAYLRLAGVLTKSARLMRTAEYFLLSFAVTVLPMTILATSESAWAWLFVAILLAMAVGLLWNLIKGAPARQADGRTLHLPAPRRGRRWDRDELPPTG